jgi:molybdenum cofactor synthesis domain-containing protein
MFTLKKSQLVAKTWAKPANLVLRLPTKPLNGIAINDKAGVHSMSNENHIALQVLSVNISEKKGTVKAPVKSIELDDMGVKLDAHAGQWHRQVSMLGTESIDKFEEQAGRKIKYGEFAENITTRGFELFKAAPLDRFISDNVILEVTQIGKSCHGDSCAIFREVGNCVMPKEGIFCRVVKNGTLKAGDILDYEPRIFKSLVITLSDRASKGEYEDKSGPKAAGFLETFFNFNNWKYSIDKHIIPDDKLDLEKLLKASLNKGYDFIFTTGGTGIGPRDITVDTVKLILDKEIPGIMDMIRMKYGADKPNALASRAVAGVAGKTLIFTMPGSVRAVDEYLSEITRSLKHLLMMLHGIDAH